MDNKRDQREYDRDNENQRQDRNQNQQTSQSNSQGRDWNSNNDNDNTNRRNSSSSRDIESRWQDIESDYRRRYPNLTDDDVNYGEGEFDNMTDRVAKRTNRNRQQVSDEIRDWDYEDNRRS